MCSETLWWVRPLRLSLLSCFWFLPPVNIPGKEDEEPEPEPPEPFEWHDDQ